MTKTNKSIIKNVEGDYLRCQTIRAFHIVLVNESKRIITNNKQTNLNTIVYESKRIVVQLWV